MLTPLRVEDAGELAGVLADREERLYQVLACTFFEPAATQELAAERLGLPFSTDRYQLAGAVRRVTERPWRRELHGPDEPG